MFKYTIINEDGTTEDFVPNKKRSYRQPTLEQLQGIVNPKAQEICSGLMMGYTIKFPNQSEGLYGPVLIRETIVK